MGNRFTCVQQVSSSDGSSRTVKLIKYDGLVETYSRPVPAAELMLQFPKHLICHSESFFIGQKIPALAEDDKLQLGHTYFLLPKHFFQSVLSFVTVASLASSSPSLNQPAACKLFDFRKTASGKLQIRVSDEFIAKQLNGDGSDDQSGWYDGCSGKVCTTPQLQKDYKQLVRGRRNLQWKPTLETINEKETRRLGSFSVRKKKKTEHEHPPLRQNHVKEQPPPPPPQHSPPFPPPATPLPPPSQRMKTLPLCS